MYQFSPRRCWLIPMGIRERQKIPICRSKRSTDRTRPGPRYPCCNRRRRSRLHVGTRCSTALYEWRTGSSTGRLVPTFPRLLSLLSEPAATASCSLGSDPRTSVVAQELRARKEGNDSSDWPEAYFEEYP